ncbi:MAG: carbon-nitrogen hydrolase family protein [Bifidobacteriaceae bacterium]|nr:carbon-nitrogen hydrolase family protein [Bifidobacteriaceae bacterium]
MTEPLSPPPVHPSRSPLRLIMVQAPQLPVDATDGTFYTFESSVRQAVEEAPTPSSPDVVTLVMFPEMHLFGTGDLPEKIAGEAQVAAGITLPRKGTPGGRFSQAAHGKGRANSSGPQSYAARFSQLAHELNIWLIPGTLCEKMRDKPTAIHNTAAVWSPQGKLVASYRKICPWRPYEIYTPGTTFTVFTIPGVGRVGFTICYDAWFPEITRQVAWKGAELIVNLVRTTTPDRELELTLARSNAIVNQAFIASLNAPAPRGYGKSILVGPEGEVLDQLDNDQPGIISAEIDLGHAQSIRDNGTLGLNRMWHQFRDSDPTIPLPLYEGSIRASRWPPAALGPNGEEISHIAKSATASSAKGDAEDSAVATPSAKNAVSTGKKSA